MINLRAEIQKTNHSKEMRTHFAGTIYQNQELFPQLLEVCSAVDEEISCRACWGLEFVCKDHLELLLPYLDIFVSILPSVYKHPAVRPMAKICTYLTHFFYIKKSVLSRTQLSTIHREKIIECCFDWLLTDQKVAAKAHAMTCLYDLGTEFGWIHPELKITLKKNYDQGSAAYKARSRMILKKLI